MSEPAATPQAPASAGSSAPVPNEEAPVAAAIVSPKILPKPKSLDENSAQHAAIEQVSARAPQRQGPVAELSQRFANESRSESSADDEAQVRSAFVDPAIPPALLRSVECRRSVCRAELRWSAQHEAGYILGLTRAVGQYVVPVGIEGAGPSDANGHRPVVAYIGLARVVPSSF